MVEINQGGEGQDAIDALSSRSRTSSQGRLQADTGAIDRLTSSFSRLREELRRLKTQATETMSALSAVSGASEIGEGRIAGNAVRTSVPPVGTTTRNATGQLFTSVSGYFSPTGGPGGPGGPGGGGPGGPGGTGGTGGSGGSGYGRGVRTYISGAESASGRTARGAEYSLQADRMSVQLQQMYGMSNAQVRQQLRMPLTNYQLLGGGAAINELLNMQANTGLTALKQASTVEAFRTISGFSLGAGDVTNMLTTMASPDVANRMFMMGGTGMYGLGGKERTGMQSIQDIIRRTGLTNPEALKGALQPGSNTRQRLTAMGVPQDMQDMVIQYAMQNVQYQRKTGDKTKMYSPSEQDDRNIMDIDTSYAVQHEKTSGARVRREEEFYGKQVDNFADFEKNLRSATKMLASFESAMGGIIGLGISIKGHPATSFTKTVIGMLNPFDGDPVDSTGLAMPAQSAAPSLYATGGDANEGKDTVLSANNEAKLAQLDPRLATPLRKMLAARPGMEISDARRSSAQQERSFRARYTRRPDLKEKTQDADRIWNGEVWVYTQHAQKGPPMAPPGQSYHEQGLAADLSQKDNEWIRQNASRFGLVHGGTNKGEKTDEPFHVQPAGVGRSRQGASASKVSSAGVSKSSAPVSGSVRSASVARNTSSPTGESAMGSFADAGQRASAIAKAGLKAQFAPIIAGTDTARGGDPVDYVSTSGPAGGGSITIAPNIYLNGTQDINNDIKRIAREVGRLLEQEVSMVKARSR